jgi:hypothetical protein
MKKLLVLSIVLFFLFLPLVKAQNFQVISTTVENATEQAEPTALTISHVGTTQVTSYPSIGQPIQFKTNISLANSLAYSVYLKAINLELADKNEYQTTITLKDNAGTTLATTSTYSDHDSDGYMNVTFSGFSTEIPASSTAYIQVYWYLTPVAEPTFVNQQLSKGTIGIYHVLENFSISSGNSDLKISNLNISVAPINWAGHVTDPTIKLAGQPLSSVVWDNVKVYGVNGTFGSDYNLTVEYEYGKVTTPSPSGVTPVPTITIPSLGAMAWFWILMACLIVAVIAIALLVFITKR